MFTPLAAVTPQKSRPLFPVFAAPLMVVEAGRLVLITVLQAVCPGSAPFGPPCLVPQPENVELPTQVVVSADALVHPEKSTRILPVGAGVELPLKDNVE